MFLRAEGERRVKNVLVGSEPIDPERTYTLAATTIYSSRAETASPCSGARRCFRTG